MRFGCLQIVLQENYQYPDNGVGQPLAGVA
jgi:hypothetical protein